ncbi:hypothetical protein ACPWSR_00945 [Alloiococcus sp. CFN-8]|uniref:hypothetical protein n=1 Tax=Alloiococcus sp. CFN-8 TaxID=3416081 RepID=UPI003CEE3100
MEEINVSKVKCPNCGGQAIPMWKRIWHSPENPMECSKCSKELYPVGKNVYLMDIPMFLAFILGYAVALISKEAILFFPIFFIGVIITTYLQHKKVPLKLKK